MHALSAACTSEQICMHQHPQKHANGRIINHVAGPPPDCSFFRAVGAEIVVRCPILIATLLTTRQRLYVLFKPNRQSLAMAATTVTDGPASNLRKRKSNTALTSEKISNGHSQALLKVNAVPTEHGQEMDKQLDEHQS